MSLIAKTGGDDFDFSFFYSFWYQKHRFQNWIPLFQKWKHFVSFAVAITGTLRLLAVTISLCNILRLKFFDFACFRSSNNHFHLVSIYHSIAFLSLKCTCTIRLKIQFCGFLVITTAWIFFLLKWMIILSLSWFMVYFVQQGKLLLRKKKILKTRNIAPAIDHSKRQFWTAVFSKSWVWQERRV